jgi:DNA-binding response OmpR family regulator
LKYDDAGRDRNRNGLEASASVSEFSSQKPGSSSVVPQRARRILLVAQGQGSVLRSELAASGYETTTAKLESTLGLVADYVPDVVVFELADAGEETEQRFLALARRLRSEASTYALPLVFCWRKDGRTARASLLGIGADDYFPISTPIKETLARLDSLFWRIEAGRRSASTSGDQRLDIDNFMLLLDLVREDIRAGATGTIGLLCAAAQAGGPPLDRQARDRTLAEAHGFLKLNLRRADSISFYGPSTLFIYMPGVGLGAAIERLRSLRNDFVDQTTGRDFALGLAGFAADAGSLEAVMEKAEAGAALGCLPDAAERIVAVGLTEIQPETGPIPIVPVPEKASQTVLQQVPAEGAAELVNGSPVAKAPAAPESREIAKPCDEIEIDLDLELDSAEFAEVDSARVHPVEVIVSAESDRSAETVDAVVTEASAENPPGLPPDPSDAAGPVPSALDVANATSETGRKGDHKSFFTEGFRPLDVRDLTMADIMEKVAATRPRSTPSPGASADPAHGAATHELQLRESGVQMPHNLLLVVADTKRMAAINSLVRSAGYEVRASFNGRQALDLVRLEHPELIIIDFRLGAMDGIETVRRLRKQTGGRLEPPIVMLIPEEEIAARNEAVELGVQRVVDADCEAAELLTGIREAGSGQ